VLARLAPEVALRVHPNNYEAILNALVRRMAGEASSRRSCGVILLRAAQRHLVQNMARGSEYEPICAGMSPPGGGKHTVTG
jgi:hypothetical protein